MFEIMLFVFGVIGMSHIIVDSKIFLPVREWFNKNWPFVGEMLGCYQCSGFWSGMFCGWAILGLPTWWHLMYLLVAGFAGSFLSMLAAAYLNYLEAKTLVDLPPEHEDKGE